MTKKSEKSSVPKKQLPKKAENQEVPEELQELEQELKTTNPDIFEGVPVEKKKAILESFSVISFHRSHSGPLPDAETLIKYDSVIPNGADRIMSMAEKQQTHRIQIENKVIDRHSGQSRLGQIFGFAIGLVGIGCGTYLAATGHPYVGGIIAGGTVVSLVYVFVTGKKMQKEERESED